MSDTFSVQNGSMIVTRGNKTRFTTEQKYPVVLGERTWVSSEPGIAYLYTLLTDDNRPGSAWGFFASDRDVFTTKVMTRGVHYSGFPDFVYVNAEIYDNAGGTRRVSITGSYLMTFLVGALPGKDTFGRAYISDIFEEATAGFWLVASQDYYVSGGGDIMRRTVYSKPLTLTTAHGQEPDSGYSAYSDYMAIRNLNDSEIRNKLEYDGIYKTGGKRYQRWKWIYKFNWARIVAGKFTA